MFSIHKLYKFAVSLFYIQHIENIFSMFHHIFGKIHLAYSFLHDINNDILYLRDISQNENFKKR